MQYTNSIGSRNSSSSSSNNNADIQNNAEVSRCGFLHKKKQINKIPSLFAQYHCYSFFFSVSFLSFFWPAAMDAASS